MWQWVQHTNISIVVKVWTIGITFIRINLARLLENTRIMFLLIIDLLFSLYGEADHFGDNAWTSESQILNLFLNKSRRN
jgi:hypothetical protein